jgi:alkanesulfonate monooxygenase SsuD/methylene tetrahydromethanopterin reductase-like flavin-dependent oxidoreductase (luciferase family)
MTRLGYQIPNFTYPGIGPAELFDVIAAQAREADESGFDTVLVMDHFYQLPHLGKPTDFMLECYTLLAALARETRNVRVSALVTGNTYRNPAFLAKTVTTLDIVSNGRFELEHTAFGYEFGTFTDRFEKLEEALQIIIPMLRGESASLAGKHYSAVDAVNQPAAIGRIPVMIGGGGERKTLRMVAQYADESNLISEAVDLPRKLDALATHCANLNRDRSEITVTWQKSVCVAPTMEEAQADLHAYFALRGLDLDSIDADFRKMLTSRVICGDPDTVGERLQADLALGVDGFTINAPANGHIPGRVALLGQVAAAVVG